MAYLACFNRPRQVKNSFKTVHVEPWFLSHLVAFASDDSILSVNQTIEELSSNPQTHQQRIIKEEIDRRLKSFREIIEFAKGTLHYDDKFISQAFRATSHLFSLQNEEELKNDWFRDQTYLFARNILRFDLMKFLHGKLSCG